MQQFQYGLVLPEYPVDLPDNQAGCSRLTVVPGIPALVAAKLLIGAAM